LPYEIKLPLEELRKRSLFLATPAFGGMVSMTYMRSVADLAALMAVQGVKMQMYMLSNESLITRARNYCCDEFVRSPCSHFMFIDADIQFNPYDVMAMLAMQSEDSPYDVLVAPYPKKCLAWEKIKVAVDKGFADKNPNDLEKFVGDYVFNPIPGTQSFSLLDPVEVLEGGTGFMMIKKSCFEKFQKAYPRRWYRPDHVRSEHFDGSREIMMYFQAEIDQFDPIPLYEDALKKIQNASSLEEAKKIVEQTIETERIETPKYSKRYLSEDYSTNQLLRKIGCKVWLLPWMKLSHYGSFNFGGSLMDLAQIGQSATADASVLDKYKTKKTA
jgi:hypothetical protein